MSSSTEVIGCPRLASSILFTKCLALCMLTAALACRCAVSSSFASSLRCRRCLLCAEYNTAGRRVDQVHSLAGSATLHQQLCGLRFQLSPLAFFQTNTAQAEVLYNAVAEAAGLYHPCSWSTSRSATLDHACSENAALSLACMQHAVLEHLMLSLIMVV